MQIHEMIDNIRNIESMVDSVQSAIERHGLDYETINSFGHARLSSLVELQLRLRELHESLDSVKSNIGKVYDYTRTKVVPDACERDNVSTSNFPGIGRLSLQSDLTVQVLDRKAQFEWLEEIGAGDAIQNTVNASTLKAILRRRVRDGLDVPDGVFKIEAFTRAAITKV